MHGLKACIQDAIVSWGQWHYLSIVWQSRFLREGIFCCVKSVRGMMHWTWWLTIFSSISICCFSSFIMSLCIALSSYLSFNNIVFLVQILECPLDPLLSNHSPVFQQLYEYAFPKTSLLPPHQCQTYPFCWGHTWKWCSGWRHWWDRQEGLQ